MTEHLCEQYSGDWFRLRLGKPTASQFHNIITPGGKPTDNKERRKYLFRLVAERLLGQAMDDGFESYWMKRGSELEGQALEAFMDSINLTGRKAGFFTTSYEHAGASPDYILDSHVLENDAGRWSEDQHEEEEKTMLLGMGLEIKCPAPYTQVEYLIDGPWDKYKAQVQGQMLVCGFKRVHFWSWHPLMPSVHVITDRDEVYIGKLEFALAQFCRELDDAEAHARGMGMFRLAEKLRLSEEMAMADNILVAG